MPRNAQIRERFLREGYVANHIGHPGVVGILDDDITEDGLVYLVMELLEGQSFSECIHTHTLTPAQIVFIGHQVLEPLATAHRRGVIHRDIKPGNIFICRDGRVKLLDLGLARVLEGNDLEPTCDGLVLGAVAFLSPEQARAKRDEIDWRTDIYSVGAMLFYALSGHYVHEAANDLDRLMAVIKNPARSLASVLPEAPAKLVAIVDRALRFDPAERWQCAEDMAAAAAAVFQELTGANIPATARTESQGKKGWARPAVGPAPAPELPSSVDVSMTDESLAVSVVFEPDARSSSAQSSATVVERPPSSADPSKR